MGRYLLYCIVKIVDGKDKYHQEFSDGDYDCKIEDYNYKDMIGNTKNNKFIDEQYGFSDSYQTKTYEWVKNEYEEFIEYFSNLWSKKSLLELLMKDHSSYMMSELEEYDDWLKWELMRSFGDILDQMDPNDMVYFVYA